MKVLLAAGHGAGDNRGGVCYNEGDNNFYYSLVLKKELEKYQSIQVDLLREKIEDNPALDKRAAAGAGYDLYFAIHSNAFSDSSVRGTEVWDSVERPNKVLAKAICDVTAGLFAHNNRGVKYREGQPGINWYGELRFNQAKSAMIVEHGFHTNTTDCSYFKNNHETIARAQAKVIADYYGLSQKDMQGTPIMAKPTATVAQMQEWARGKKAHEKFVELAPVYFDISNMVGVNPIVIYAQSAKETGYMNFGGVLDITYNNPCGMKTTTGGPNQDPNAHQRFGDWAQGIRAQVDHLALYAGAPGYPQWDTPDPRHFAYLHGTAKTVEELGGKWAGSATYGTDIVKMMKEIESIRVEEPVAPVDPEPVKELETVELDLWEKTIVGVNWNGGRITIVYRTKDE